VRVTSRSGFFSGSGGFRSVSMIWSMLMWPQPPVARSTICSRAASPARVRNVPGSRLQTLRTAGPVVRTGRGAGDAAVDQQVDAGLAGVGAAADQEPQVSPLDAELGRGEGARRAIAAAEGVHQPAAQVAADRHLPGQRSPRRSGAEGCAGRLPRAVVDSFEVRQEDCPAPPRAVRVRREPGGSRQRPRVRAWAWSDRRASGHVGCITAAPAARPRREGGNPVSFLAASFHRP